MNVLIIEDEQASARKLKGYLSVLRPDWTIVGTLTGVRESIAWLKAHPEPDVIFLDVQLADGESLLIFDAVSIESYVIFLTAFSDYALQAFNLNSVDYLLKPFGKRDTEKSLAKLDAFIFNRHGMRSLVDAPSLTPFPERLLVKKGVTYRTLPVAEIAYVVKDPLLFVVTRAGEKFLYDASLEEMVQKLDPRRFFRINRQFMVSYDAIRTLVPASSNRIELKLEPTPGSPVIVSQGKVAALKAWLSDWDA